MKPNLGEKILQPTGQKSLKILEVIFLPLVPFSLGLLTLGSLTVREHKHRELVSVTGGNADNSQKMSPLLLFLLAKSYLKKSRMILL